MMASETFNARSIFSQILWLVTANDLARSFKMGSVRPSAHCAHRRRDRNRAARASRSQITDRNGVYECAAARSPTTVSAPPPRAPVGASFVEKRMPGAGKERGELAALSGL